MLLSVANLLNAQTVSTKTLTGATPTGFPNYTIGNSYILNPALTTATSFTLSFDYARIYQFAQNTTFVPNVNYTTTTGTGTVYPILTNTTSTPTSFSIQINETTLNKININNPSGPPTGGWVYQFLTIYYTDLNTGINENMSDLNEIQIFPNPTKDFITIQDLKTAKVLVYDVLGKQLKNKEFENEDITLNISDLPQGIYYVEIKTINGNRINKIIKNN